MAQDDIEIDIDLDGLESAIAQLGEEEEEKHRRVEHALETSAVEIRDDAKKNAPVDTTNLRNSISQRATKDSGPGREVYTGLEYAPRQELGFRGTDSLGRTYDQKGSHYMKRAFESNRRETINRLRRALQG